MARLFARCCDRDKLYGFAFTALTIPKAAIASTTISSCSIPMPNGLSGRLLWNDALYGYTVGHQRDDLSFDRRDSAPFMPKCRGHRTPHFTWGDDQPPRRPWTKRSSTRCTCGGLPSCIRRCPRIVRGTFGALAAPAVLDYLRDLGITAIEFLPAQAFIDDGTWSREGLVNYWGYNSIAFFAPEARYAQQRRQLVRVQDDGQAPARRRASRSFSMSSTTTPPKAISSARRCRSAASTMRSYYCLDADDRRYYVDFTGCGNSLNLHHPRVLQLVMDSLRYWVQEMHVDGFRFDLATTLAREQDSRSTSSPDFSTPSARIRSSRR